MRAVVVVESLAKVPRFDELRDMLFLAGVPLATLDVTAVVLEDTRAIKARHVREAAPGLVERIGERAAVLLVGNTALEAVTGKKGIKQRRGRPFQQGSCIYVPILPPGVMAYDDRSTALIQADVTLFADVVRKGKVPREEALDWTIVDTREKFEAMLIDLKGTVSFDVETGWQDPETGQWHGALYPWKGHVGPDGEWVLDARVISVGFGTRTRQWCLPIHHPEATTEASLGLSLAQIFARLDRRMRDCFLVAHNGKFDNQWLRIHHGVDWRPDFDTMIAHWMLDENSFHGLKGLAQTYFGAPSYDVDKDSKGGAGPLYPHCMYLAHDVYYTRALRFKFGKLLDRDVGVRRAFDSIMMPIARLFCDVEHQGVLVDVDRFEEAEVHLRDTIRQAEKELHKACAAEIEGYEPGDVNWRSPKQLVDLFFTKLGLKALDRTKSGKSASTSESVLTRLDHPVAVALLKYRGADQTLKMFIDGWRPFLVKHADGWRLHPSFKLIGTVTGRASCEHPNLQQVPRDSLIRSLIDAALGWCLFDMDLSQIEMRISAELSGDQVLLGIFERDEDVHWMTATKEIARGGGMAAEVLGTAKLFVVKYPKTPWLAEVCPAHWRGGRFDASRADRLTYSEAMQIVYRMGPELAADLMPAWKELRKKAKAINFGYLFGMWWKKMVIYARDNYGVKLSDRQAQESRKSFFSTYPALAPWHERQRRYARRHGHVRSLSGALRRLPAAQLADDCPERGEALRQAINSPVQRFACELNYMVLLQLVEEFGLDVVRPIGTVHDAILAEVLESRVAEVYERVDQIMRKPRMLEELEIRIRVPIKGESKIGPWSKGVSLERWRQQRKVA